jgi:glycine oxidase
MIDCCIVGGGIIGLSIARELAGRGLAVRVLCRDRRRETASWAAAGIFPPAPDDPRATANERLTAWSDRLHRVWARELLEETGIDTGLRACGGLHVSADAAGRERLLAAAASWRARGAACEWLDARDLAAREPALAGAVGRGAITDGYCLPEEMQIRPPRHLEALERSCRDRGVEITHDAVVRGIGVHDRLVTDATATIAGSDEIIRSGAWVLAAGAWTEGLGAALGLAVETRPIRGQIVQLRLVRPTLTRVVNRGLDYLVPREDGTLLAGSTLEDAGFDATTDDQAIARLLTVTRDLLGDLPDAAVEQSWAGLRPGTADGLPTIGPVPSVTNAFVAAGHFRAGLHQSTGTAVIVADLVTGVPTAMGIADFAADRPPRPPTCDSVPAMLARAHAER